MSRFKRTEIIKFPSHNVKEDSDKLYWGQLSDIVTIQEYGAIRSVDVNPSDPNIIAATSHGKVQLYNVATMELHKSFNKFKETAFSGKFRHDGGLLCAGTGEGVVKVFDTNSKSLLRVMSGHTAAVQHCQFQHGVGAGLVSWSDDNSVRLWDLAAETSIGQINHHSDYVRAGSLCSQQPDIIVSGGYDHKLAVWDKRDLEKPSVQMDHGYPVESVLMLPGGGLLVSVGGNYIKVWDMLGGGRLLSSLSPHHKTVTSVSLSQNGKCLVTGSLDRQVIWTDISTFRQVYNKHMSSAVMSVGLGGDDDDYLAVGMLDGLIQLHKRKIVRIEDGMIVNSRRHKRAKNHKYLQYTQYTPSIGDQVVTDGKHKDIELKHDNLLRKFEYSKALDAVLKPYVARKKPEYTYSLLMELVRREGLTRAIAGRDEKQLCLLLQFLNRYISDNRFSRLCIHVCNIVIDLYLPHHGMTSRVDNLLKEMMRRLDKEVNYLETLMELTGAVDVVLTSAFNKQMDKPQPVIEHRVCSLPS